MTSATVTTFQLDADPKFLNELARAEALIAEETAEAPGWTREEAAVALARVVARWRGDFLALSIVDGEISVELAPGWRDHVSLSAA